MGLAFFLGAEAFFFAEVARSLAAFFVLAALDPVDFFLAVTPRSYPDWAQPRSDDSHEIRIVVNPLRQHVGEWVSEQDILDRNSIGGSVAGDIGRRLRWPGGGVGKRKESSEPFRRQEDGEYEHHHKIPPANGRRDNERGE